MPQLLVICLVVFDLGSGAFKILALPADDHHAVSSAAASGQDSEALARRPQKRGKASGLVAGAPQDVDIMDALTQQLAETTIQSVEEDSEELKLLDRAVKIVQSQPESRKVQADLESLISLRPRCVAVLNEIEEKYNEQNSATEDEYDRISTETERLEGSLELIEGQVQAILEKYQRRRKKKGIRAKAPQGGGPASGGSSGWWFFWRGCSILK